MGRYLGKKGKELEEGWVMSRVEYAAELFSLMYVWNRRTKGWKEPLGKLFAATNKWMKINMMKWDRRRLAAKADRQKPQLKIPRLDAREAV